MLMPVQKERWIVRDFFDSGNMADEAKKLKNLRKNKETFTIVRAYRQ